MPPKPGEKLDFAAQMALAMSQPSARKSKHSDKSTNSSKDDLFKSKGKPRGDGAKRAARDLTDSPAFARKEQKHSTTTPNLDSQDWARSQKNMERKAKLYNAIKRGDAEDVGGRYEVDFDRKWAEKQEAGVERASEDEFSGDEEGVETAGTVEIQDEFGRTRVVDKKEAARLERVRKAEERQERMREELRPQAPGGLIYGDTIQSDAFKAKDGMEYLAAKRDKSETPPPEQHFDSRQESRARGTGFYGFSQDAEERRRQKEELEERRKETERARGEGESSEEKMARERIEEERKRAWAKKGSKRMADDFLGELEAERDGKRRFVKGGEMGEDGVEKGLRDD